VRVVSVEKDMKKVGKLNLVKSSAAFLAAVIVACETQAEHIRKGTRFSTKKFEKVTTK
jgi:hypothetical protein